MDAFSKAVVMLRRIGTAVKSVRLDKYFSTGKGYQALWQVCFYVFDS
jgi:transposase